MGSFLDKLICHIFGHARPDSRVAEIVVHDTLDQLQWQCPRCGDRVVEYH